MALLFCSAIANIEKKKKAQDLDGTFEHWLNLTLIWFKESAHHC